MGCLPPAEFSGPRTTPGPEHAINNYLLNGLTLMPSRSTDCAACGWSENFPTAQDYRLDHSLPDAFIPEVFIVPSTVLGFGAAESSHLRERTVHQLPSKARSRTQY